MRSTRRFVQFLLAAVLLLSLAPFASLSHPADAATLYQVTGKVSNQAGTAIAGATVTALDANSATIASSTTGSDGRYALAVEAGTCDIQVTPPSGSGYQTSTLQGRIISADTSIDIALVPAGAVTLSGRVLDRAGNGVPNQRLRLTTSGTNIFIDHLTDATEAYQLSVAPGSYDLYLYGENTNPALNVPRAHYHYSLTPLQLSADTVLNVTIPAYAVRVRVQDATGTPIPNVALTNQAATNYSLSLGSVPAYGGSLYPSSLPLVRTDAAGEAVLWLFPTEPGRTPYIITATPPTGSPFATVNLSNTTVTADQELVVALQFIHAPPVTTATTDRAPTAAGTYPGPVTVTLAATAASGQTIANTYL